MLKLHNDFSLIPGQTWLNVASEGPLPNQARQALLQAIEWKSAPHLLTIPKFQKVPIELKKSIAALLSVDQQDIILGNSATYGLHLLANGLSFSFGDEIILMENDFPSDILPWLSLQNKGVIVHQLKPQQYVLTLQEIKNAINPRTKLICLPLVHSFTGHKLDISGIGHWCRMHGILCVVNISQAAGSFDIDLSAMEVDAVVCAGYKWLLGPYGTGFCWIRKEIRRQLNYAQNYWINLMDEKSLGQDGKISLIDDHSARRYDVFGTANFFNFVPWQASIDYLLKIGISHIHQHNQGLINEFFENISLKDYNFISPQSSQQRTNIIVLSCRETHKNLDLIEYLKTQGYYLAFWKNNLRISPHLYNTIEEMKGLASAMNQYACT